jgi:Tfp pilus assembly protein FimV
MLYASPPNFAMPLVLSCALMSSVWAAESPRQAPLELPKEFMSAEVTPAKKPMSKSIKLVKADIAQEPVPAASSAVAKPVAPVGKPLPEEMVAPVWKTHTVVAGDTLEKLVKKYYGNSPLKPEVLRDWVVVNNPKAFTKVNTKKLQPGTVLNLADQAELIQKLMPSAVSKANVEPNSPPANPLPAPVGGAAAHQGGNFQALVEPNKRNWVRYP